MKSKSLTAALSIAAVLACGFCSALLFHYERSSTRGLPYRPVFTRDAADHWTAYAGAWETVNGSMRNDSNDRGAKLVTGSPRWKDYAIDADIQLLGPGDAGLIARVRDPETGVDSYSGFYAGLRTNDGTLVLGRAQHGWYEFPIQNMPGGVHPFRWYHMRLSVIGCTVSATATSYDSQARTTISRTMRECPEAGAIGLRSYYAGGLWRNVSVRPLTGLTPAIEDSGLSRSLPEADSPGRGLPGDYIMNSRESNRSPLTGPNHIQSIASLRFEPQVGDKRGTVRGLVVLTTPALFVQDSTGGVAVRARVSPSLKIGDEVEVTGIIRPRAFESLLDDAHVELLWQANAAPPLSVTANQAAGGAFTAMFVQLEGLLSRKSVNADGAVALTLDSGPQSFRALLNPGRISSRLQKLRTGSTLRLRGVCVVAPEYTGNTTPFVLLIRSAEDVQVIAGPPWWTLSRLLPYGVAALILLAIAGQLYVAAKHWRLRAVVEERGRLAHEIHDTLAQSFAGIGYQLRAVRKSVPPENPLLQEQLELACDMVRHSHEEARRSIAALRPETLEAATLEAALRQCAERMAHNGPVIIRSTTAGTPVAIPLRIKDTFFRIGQEAIANAIRHSDARRIDIGIRYDQSSLTVTVLDDGKGFDTAVPAGGFGLVGMGKRAQSVSASLHVQSSPGSGTQVVVTAAVPAPIPLTAWPGHLYRQYRTNGTLRPNPYSYRG